MQQLTGYVIYAPAEEHALQRFLKNSEGIAFRAVTTVESSVDLLDCKTAAAYLGRALTAQEIRQTLSHLAVWRKIAADFSLADEAFVLVAEAAQIVQAGFAQAALDYANVYRGYGLINLQDSSLSDYPLYQLGDSLEALVYSNATQYNNRGAGFYLIKKSLIKTILEQLENKKPAWRIADFTRYCPQEALAQARVLLSESPFTKLAPQKTPMFSIVVPIYNVAVYLQQTIDSVLAQNYLSYEIILIDDGSTDDSLAICSRYAAEYPHIVFLHKINQGVAYARNDAMRLARGEYLMFLDGDDYWEGDNVLHELAQLIHQENYPDIIFNYLTSVYPERIYAHQMTCEKLAGDFHQQFSSLYDAGIYLGFSSSKIIKRKIIIDNQYFFPTVYTYEDIPWSYGLVHYLRSYAVYPKAFYMYRREREGSITALINEAKQVDLFANFQLIAEELGRIKAENPMLYPAMKKYAADIHQYNMKCYELFTPENKASLLPQKEKYDALVNQCLA